MQVETGESCVGLEVKTPRVSTLLEVPYPSFTRRYSAIFNTIPLESESQYLLTYVLLLLVHLECLSHDDSMYTIITHLLLANSIFPPL